MRTGHLDLGVADRLGLVVGLVVLRAVGAI